jgi:hypothetical protein
MNTSTNKVSRKQKVKALYQEQGVEAAHTLGLRLRLKPSTLSTWTSAWRREGLKVAKVAPKAKAKVAKSTPTPNNAEPAPKPGNGGGEVTPVN